MIWESCNGSAYIREISGQLFRLVESQEQIATLSYVDTLAEQALLEDLLENVKPPLPDVGEGLHYLLKTPFRYPPLEWGSRFGRTFEPSIFYGGCDIPATLAESAYYRLVFWYSIDAPAVKDSIRSEHTLFSVDYHTRSGIQLQHPPFDAYREQLTDPSNYQSSQHIGTAMRTVGVEAFEYQSARDPRQHCCVGLFTPTPFCQNQPVQKSQWLCETHSEQVLFKQHGENTVSQFSFQDLTVNGRLPLPA